MQRHHRPLAEANQCHIPWLEISARECCIDIGIEDGFGGANLRQNTRRVAVLKGKPLVAVRCHIAGKGGIGRHEMGVGQFQHRRKAQQVITIRTQAMKKDNDAFRNTAGGWKLGAVECCG